LKVAYFSPLPPERTGIADYSALLLPVLRRRLDVVTVRRGAKRPPRGTDVALYHIGNHPEMHGWIVEALRRRPGVVVLHEFVLHHLVAGLTVGRGDREGYLDAMQREAGVVGRLLAHGVVDGLLPPLWEVRPEEFPLAAEIVDLADGVIVHSLFVEERVRELGYTKPVWRIPLPAKPDPAPVPERPKGSPVIGCLGYLNTSKRLPQLLAAFARVRRKLPEATLVLAGATAPGLDLDDELRRAGLDRERDGVIVLGYVDERRFQSLLAGCDVCVSLRSPTMGETSASAVSALALGKPLVVSDIGWFAELPDSVAAKIPVGGEEEEAVLAATLERLGGDSALRERMSELAREYVRAEHDLERVADLYLAALEEAAGGSAVREAVYGELAQAASEVGLDVAQPEVSEIAERAAEVRLGG
jgi:glycosyltransferase involved in cell wall biosynthesis